MPWIPHDIVIGRSAELLEDDRLTYNPTLMIDLTGVVKIYDGKPAVDGVDLHVGRGRIHGLIGPNGAGKTTTLKMLATLIKPDRGTVRIAGLDLPDGVAAARRLLGYMGDHQGSFRGFSAEEYLAYFGRLHRLSGAGLRRRIGDVLDLTDLGAVRDERVSALSQGMRQRLALAKTLLHDPELLILDEPASGLDPRARIEIRELLRELSRMGKTVVISSHILADLEDICTDIAIIEQGKLVMSGELEEIRQNARAAARRSVRVRVAPGDGPRALEALRGLAGAAVAEAPGGPAGELRVDLDGAGGNAVLAELIARGIEVLSFSEERTSLEAIFMDSTRGAVQ
jgi:ABC-2 type transport system ATP-binding protein